MTRKLLALITLIVVVVLLVLANMITGFMGLNFRHDLTEDKIYTLSDGTRNVLERIPEDREVQIRLHATGDTRLMPEMLRQHARQVEDLLKEYVNASDGRVTFERIDPRPDTEAEDRAIEDQIRALQMQGGENVYLGVAVQSLANKEVIPFLNPNEEAQLEYQVTRAVANTISSGDKVVAVSSAIPVMGSMPMMPMMQQQGQQQWILLQQLERDYEVRDIGMDFDSIDEEVEVLLVIHPAGISPRAEYAIDQFVLRGGRVLAFVDPQAIVSTLYGGQQNMMGMPQSAVPPVSDLPNLLPNWGIEFDPGEVVADMNLRTPFNRRQPSPMFLSLTEDEINSDSFVTAPLESVQVYEAGSFKLQESEGMSHMVLLQSSPNSDLIEVSTAVEARDQNLLSFRSLSRRQILGVQVSGKLQTAFPDGPPPAPPAPEGPPPGMIPGAPGNDETSEAADSVETDLVDTDPAGDGADEESQSNSESAAQDKESADAPEETVADEAAESEPQGPESTSDQESGESGDGGSEAEATAEDEESPNNGEPANDDSEDPASETGTAVSEEDPTSGDAGTSAGTDGTVDGEADPEDEVAAELPEGHLAESVSDDGLLMVFADSDFLYDRFVVMQDPMTGALRVGNGNMPLALNAVEFLLGGSDMIAIRSRTGASRPFTRMNELRDEVEAEYRPKIEELEEQLREIEGEISNLRMQQDEEGNLVVMMTEEQREKLQDLEPTARDLDRQLRETRMEVRRRIDRMEMRITLLNVLVVPGAVIVLGLLVALVRRPLTRAR